MIGLLRGTLAHGGEATVVVDVGGVGYQVTVTPATRMALGAEPGEFLLWIHTQLRQDALVLFGFPSQVEREVFELLLTTPGVGPSLAMAILGSLGARGVEAAVAAEDASAFEQVPGVGRKTAARLVLELQGKLVGVELSGEALGSGAPPGAEELAEVADALSALGYSSEEVRRALGVLEGDEAVEVALRLALRELSRR